MLVLSPNDWGWARQKLGTKVLVWASHTSGRVRYPGHPPHCFPRLTGKELDRK